jgi:hypothetical protein
MTEVLHTPNKERVITTNAWAFLHWLRVVRQVALADWDALQRWSADNHTAFAAAFAEFSGLTASPIRLTRRSGLPARLVVRPDSTERPTLPRRSASAASPPAAIATLLARDWPREALIGPFAELLLHTDVRPDDRLLVCGAAWPWLTALLEGTTIILLNNGGDLLGSAEEDRATVLVASCDALANAAFPRSGHRHQLPELRTIVATGGPLSPEGRRRIYTWVKADVMLLARSGDMFWGNPLEPVLARPAATPAFLTPPAATPVPR